MLSKKEDVPELYWSIVIEPSWVQSGLWRIVDNTAQVISTSPPSAWKLDEELIDAVDTTLSAAVQELPDDYPDPKNTVFGVAYSWTKDGNIKKDHLEQIKNLCDNLSLKPAGFVVIPEAIVHLKKSIEGSPTTAVVIGIFENEIELSLYSLGNVKGNTNVARSVSVVDDVVEGLTRLSLGENIPSRFILYNGKEGELEEFRQNLIKADWDLHTEIKFLHPPKIEIIQSNEKVEAVSLAGASEIANVSTISDLNKTKKEPSIDLESDNKFGVDDFPEDYTVAKKVNTKDDNIINTNEISPEDVGFVVGKDVVPSEDELSRSSFATDKIKHSNSSADTNNNTDLTTIEKTKRINFTNFLGKVSLKSFFKKDKKDSIDEKKERQKVSFSPFFKIFKIGFLIIIFLIAALVSAYWYLPKATVSVVVAGKKLQEKVEIVVDPEAQEVNFENNILPGEEIKTTVSADRTRSTTGTKTVGEKSTGELTIYRVGSSLSLSKGDVIVGPNNLNFTLDDDYSIASGSASSPSETTAKVTAKEIGAQFNLASGTSFTIAGYSIVDLEAKNSSAFSGGTSTEISAVSKEDQEILLEDLQDELLNEALDELKKVVDKDNYLVEESIIFDISQQDYSAKVADEAETLKLELTLDVQALTVNEKTLKEIAKKSLEDKIPTGYVLRNEQVDVEFTFDRQEGEKYYFPANVVANLLPEINPDTIIASISGKTPSEAEKYFNEQVPGFVKADLLIKPPLPEKIKYLPRVHKNIEIEIIAKK